MCWAIAKFTNMESWSHYSTCDVTATCVLLQNGYCPIAYASEDSEVFEILKKTATIEPDPETGLYIYETLDDFFEALKKCVAAKQGRILRSINSNRVWV